MKLKKFIAALLVMSMTAACEQGASGDVFSKANIGTVLGAGTGAAVGHSIGKGKGNTIAIVAGTLLGAGLGRSIGNSLDKADLAAAERTSQSALENAPTGKSVAWKNPDSGNSGTITPTKTYTSGNQQCREYSQTVTIGGKKEQAYGHACRQDDGSWKIKQ